MFLSLDIMCSCNVCTTMLHWASHSWITSKWAFILVKPLLSRSQFRCHMYYLFYLEKCYYVIVAIYCWDSSVVSVGFCLFFFFWVFTIAVRIPSNWQWHPLSELFTNSDLVNYTDVYDPKLNFWSIWEWAVNWKNKFTCQHIF